MLAQSGKYLEHCWYLEFLIKQSPDQKVTHLHELRLKSLLQLFVTRYHLEIVKY